MANEDLIVGGIFPKLFTFNGNLQDLPEKIRLIKPNDPCVIADLRTNQSDTNHASTFTTTNIGSNEFYSPIGCGTSVNGKQVYWDKIQGTSGNTCWVYQ